MKFKRYRVRTWDSKGILLDFTMWTEGGSLKYMHNWTRWYLKKCENHSLVDPALYLQIHKYVGGKWVPLVNKGHYQYVNELISRGVIV